jgi:hypothetical protein
MAAFFLPFQPTLIWALSDTQYVQVAGWAVEKGWVNQSFSHALVPLKTKGVASRTLNGNFMIASPGQMSLHELQQLFDTHI